MQSQPQNNHPGQYGPVLYTVPHIASCIGTPSILSDLQRLRGSRETAVPHDERWRAEQLVRTPEFIEWLQSPQSSQLLVHGPFLARGHSSGLSFVCLSLTDVLASHSDRFLPLAFFCGMHTDQERDRHTGGRALIRSLIYQLLGHIKRFLGSPGVTMHPQALQGIQNGDLEALKSLFRSLISFIPPHVTVCCVVDGVNHYERDEFWGEAAQVLGLLVELSAQTPPMCARIKVLFTSLNTTSYVRQWFPNQLLVPVAHMVPMFTEPGTVWLEREIFRTIQPRAPGP